MKIAVVGATGMVGRVMLQKVAQFGLPVTEIIPVASERSAGETVEFEGRSYTVITLAEAVARKPHLALFSAGGDVSLQWAPRFAEVGCTVIDNSSAWRMNPDVPLVVPEVNGETLTGNNRIIANPNCSTIQLVMVLHPLHKAFGVQRAVVSTYQSVTGTGQKGLDQLEREQAGDTTKGVYPHPIHRNVIPQCDVFTDNGYTKEEMKLTNETVKILGDAGVKVAATAVRVPVLGGHSEAVNIRLSKPATAEQIKDVLSNMPGVVVVDEPQQSHYPTPQEAHGKDEVFVGRIRPDISEAGSFNLWIVADNLCKGAATNAVQIARYLIDHKLLHQGHPVQTQA